MSRLEEFRREKDEFFAHSHQSPLTHEQQASFPGLQYFPESQQLVIEAELDTNVDQVPVTLATTTGDQEVYRRAGVVRFEVDGRQAQVTLFASEQQADLFLPFRDATSGHETYSAGRYLEVDRPRDGRVAIDFNYAYNPYCAYNEAWSCPLPPVENWLEVPIRAGEKSYPGHVTSGSASVEAS